jgi:radical SAM family protein/B12 binding protein
MLALAMHALLISTYELGRQPFGLASPAAWLRAAGWDVTCVDISRDRLRREAIQRADVIGIHLPMHTATRLAGSVISAIKPINPSARLCAYGLYAPLNEEWLRSLGVDAVFGGEFEEELTRFAGLKACTTHDGATVPRLRFLVPDRRGLPPLRNYATLHLGDGRTKIVGATEASRGCKHLCRHCPVVPIYGGQFRVVPADVVLADVEAQIGAGAEHISFGDPDFFNGPTHAMRVVEALHAAHPDLTYDVTIKIEHLLRHRDLLSDLVRTGCAFVTSAVESIDDDVLARLEKGHTRDDFATAAALCREAGLTLTPTFVAFHPWLKLDGYCDLLECVQDLDLVDHVAPIQLAIRLLIPRGSRLLELEEVQALVGPFDGDTLAYPWSHSDPRVDELQRDVSHIVGVRTAGDRRAVFAEIAAVAFERAGRRRRPILPQPTRAAVPHLSEPWYCCAEPNPDHLALV